MATDQDFAAAVAFVIAQEVDPAHPDAATATPGDPGGLTKYGISSREYPGLDVANLTRPDAVRIYYSDYWQASGADQLAMPLAQVVLDTAVNQGVPAAQQLLQDSGGDVNSYLALRAQRYLHTAQSVPQLAQFLPDWLHRLEALTAAITPSGAVGAGVLVLLAVAVGILAAHGKLPLRRRG